MITKRKRCNQFFYLLYKLASLWKGKRVGNFGIVHPEVIQSPSCFRSKPQPTKSVSICCLTDSFFFFVHYASGFDELWKHSVSLLFRWDRLRSSCLDGLCSSLVLNRCNSWFSFLWIYLYFVQKCYYLLQEPSFLFDRDNNVSLFFYFHEIELFHN